MSYKHQKAYRMPILDQTQYQYLFLYQRMDSPQAGPFVLETQRDYFLFCQCQNVLQPSDQVLQIFQQTSHPLALGRLVLDLLLLVYRLTQHTLGTYLLLCCQTYHRIFVVKNKKYPLLLELHLHVFSSFVLSST